MIAVSAAWKAARKSGAFGIDVKGNLWLPQSIAGSVAAGAFSASFPALAVYDGDRTHVNAGPATGLYPPPAGPENFIGGGMWKGIDADTGTTRYASTIDAYPLGPLNGVDLWIVSLGGIANVVTVAGANRCIEIGQAAPAGTNATRAVGDVPIGCEMSVDMYCFPAAAATVNDGPSVFGVIGFRMQPDGVHAFGLPFGIGPVIGALPTAGFVTYRVVRDAVGSTTWYVAGVPILTAATSDPNNGTLFVQSFSVGGLTPSTRYDNVTIKGGPGNYLILDRGANAGTYDRVLMWNHPTDGGVKSFRLATGPASTGPWTDVTAYEEVRAWEMHNGRSNVAIAGSTVTVTPVTGTGQNKPSIPSVIDCRFLAGNAARWLRLFVSVAGPDAAGAGERRPKVCEVELWRRVSLPSEEVSIEVSHSLDVKLQGVTARQCALGLCNQDLEVSSADFTRPRTGQASIDAIPQIELLVGIRGTGEFVPFGTYAVDTADIDLPNRKINLSGRAANERPLFDHRAPLWRTNITYDDASRQLWSACNIGQGMVAVEPSVRILPYFAPGDTGRTELDQLRQAAGDRGVYVTADGILSTLSYLTSYDGAPLHDYGAYPTTNHFDPVWWDATQPALLWTQERTFATNKPSGKIDDRDVDNMTKWDVRQPVTTRTAGFRVYGAAARTINGPAADNGIAIPCVMAQRPATNDFYFLTGSGVGTGWPRLIAGWTVNNGVGTRILANQTMAAESAGATFIGNVLYWWEGATLKSQDVTVAWAPTTIGADGGPTPNTLAPVGTVLYWNRGSVLVKWTTGSAWATRTAIGSPLTDAIGSLKAIGTDLYGACFPALPSSPGMFRFDTTGTFPTNVSTLSSQTPLRNVGGFAYLNGRIVAANGAGIPCLTFDGWDGQDGTPTTTYGAPSGTSSLGGMAISSATMFGRRPIAAIGGGTVLIWFRDPLAVDDDLPQSIIYGLKEKSSYELGGASSCVNAVDMNVYTYMLAPGSEVYRDDGPVTAFRDQIRRIECNATVDPLTFFVSGGGFGSLVGPRHCRFPGIYQLFALNATTLSSSTATNRTTPPDSPTGDPSLQSSLKIDNRFVVSQSSAYDIASRLFYENRVGVRWLSADTAIYPELEVGDVLSIAWTQRTNAKVQTLNVKARVVSMTHTIASGEARTSLELVTVS